MEEREKVCILCGRKETMIGYICRECQNKIQQQLVEKREQMWQEAAEAANGQLTDSDKKGR